MLRVIAVATLVLTASSAFADEAAARKSFAAGERAYNLGEFEKAVTLFKQAYAEWDEPAFLFNIAQTYRQIGDCKQSQFFYKRFLALKANDTKKPIKPELQTEVEKRIAELEECIRREIASKPPQQLDNGQSPTPAVTAAKSATTTTTAQPAQTDEPTDEDDEEEPPTPPSDQPKLFSLRAQAGAAKLGAGDLDTKLTFAGGFVGGYPLALAPKLQLELGVAFSYVPVPYHTITDEAGTGGVINLLANVAPSYEIIPRLAARADVGVGVLLFSGLGKMGNPFTKDGSPASGALSTFAVRAAISVDYAVTRNVVITATPIAFGYSPAPEGLQPGISSLTTLSFLAGIGYRQ